jgi:rubrerythrin
MSDLSDKELRDFHHDNAGDDTVDRLVAEVRRLRAALAAAVERVKELTAELAQERAWHYEQSDKAHAAESRAEGLAEALREVVEADVDLWPCPWCGRHIAEGTDPYESGGGQHGFMCSLAAGRRLLAPAPAAPEVKP